MDHLPYEEANLFSELIVMTRGPSNDMPRMRWHHERHAQSVRPWRELARDFLSAIAQHKNVLSITKLLSMVSTPRLHKVRLRFTDGASIVSCESILANVRDPYPGNIEQLAAGTPSTAAAINAQAAALAAAAKLRAADDERRQAKRQPCRQAHGRGGGPRRLEDREDRRRRGAGSAVAPVPTHQGTVLPR
jgi:hypothetical protein